MKTRARYLWSDAASTVGVLAFVLAVLVSIDERVREQMGLIGAPDTMNGVGSQAGEVWSAIYDAVRTQSIEHAPMMIFIVVATVLLLCMMRT